MKQKIEDKGKQFKINNNNRKKFRDSKGAVKQIRQFLQILGNNGWERVQGLLLMTVLYQTIGAMFI